jgi:Zn-dependent protease with chaperone function
MNSKVDYKVTRKENLYFYVRLIFSLSIYFLIVLGILYSLGMEGSDAVAVYALYAYLILIVLLLFFRMGVIIGYLKGNAVKLSKNQFPDIYEVVVKQSELLGINKTPSIYILQSGGILNAFATRFLGHNYIILYSEIVEASYDQDKNILEFIIAHELGHIKRKHMLKSLLLLPSLLIPFLGAAYSRACEYTCDNIAYALAPKGMKSGLLMLASGPSIYKKVNTNEYLRQISTEDGFWRWFAEKISSHPNLTKRLAAFPLEKDTPIMKETAPIIKKNEEEDDHSRYMPQ